MNSLNRMAMMAFVGLAVALAAGQSQAANGTYSSEQTGPRWEDQMADALIARPIGIAATGAGAVIWGISLPFSLLGGNAGEAADNLIGGPAREAFVRCLGCRAAGRKQTEQQLND